MKKITIIICLLVALVILMPSASRWLEIKSAELNCERFEREKDPVKIDSPSSPTTEVYISKATMYMTQGTVYFEQGYLNAAIFCYDKAIKLDPNLTLAYVNRGKVYSQQGQLDKAILDYNRAIETDSNNADAYRLRGFTYIEKGDLDQAITDCNKAIEVRTNESAAGISRQRSSDPSEADSYWVRGVAYQYKGDLTQALSDYNQAIKIGSFFHPAAYYLDRAKLYFQMGEYDKSWEDVHKIESLSVKVDPVFLKKLKKYSVSRK